MEKKFVATKVILVNHEGNILLMRDSGAGDHANAKGTWDVPGGRMEQGESPAQALVREVKEETGVEIDPAIARPCHVDIWGVGGDVANAPIIGIFYVVHIGAADVRLSAEHTEYVWFDPKLPVPESTKGSVQNALAAYFQQKINLV